MTVPRLTLRSIELRSVSIPLKRPAMGDEGRGTVIVSTFEVGRRFRCTMPSIVASSTPAR
jgi:hypothetical protein